eukprot:TRINITY_DN17631_c0_g1_i2.p1 TRINITY_DN17631_c0_g1~~TRINITY_DN17631_c0_g1_i2.p1  ORF type:complete len:509 (+),score=71.26 TRINITY_DN17631_c0_g1_i2:154-1680(+)
MEFERALFRIYQRTMNSGSVKNVRTWVEWWMPWVILGTGAALTWLHTEYVGEARCLPAEMRRLGLWNHTADGPLLEDDSLLSLHVVTDSPGEEEAGSGEALLEGHLRLHMEGASAKAGSGLSIDGENVSALQEAGWRRRGKPILRYRYGFDREIMMLRPAVFDKHAFQWRNVSIQESCLMSSSVLRFLFRTMDAYDTLVVNELAYTFRSRGYLERVEDDSIDAAQVEAWIWSKEQVESAYPSTSRPIIVAAVRKAAILLKAVISFVLISSITGFFIRVAVNGSAVLMFPVAMCAQRYNPHNRMSIGLLSRSFPWIGVYVEVLRRANRPSWPLFRSQLVFLLLQSFGYLSCNLAWRFILYRKGSPEGFEERIFSLCSILELFNLIFVRSVSSTVVYPRVVTACLVYLHFYMFCNFYPFHTLAFVLCASICVYGMAYCLNNFEEPALRGDPFAHTTPTAVHPRATYLLQLSPSWTLETAPLWTMFYAPEPPSRFPDEALRSVSDQEYLLP